QTVPAVRPGPGRFEYSYGLRGKLAAFSATALVWKCFCSSPTKASFSSVLCHRACSEIRIASDSMRCMRRIECEADAVAPAVRKKSCECSPHYDRQRKRRETRTDPNGRAARIGVRRALKLRVSAILHAAFPLATVAAPEVPS